VLRLAAIPSEQRGGLQSAVEIVLAEIGQGVHGDSPWQTKNAD